MKIVTNPEPRPKDDDRPVTAVSYNLSTDHPECLGFSPDMGDFYFAGDVPLIVCPNEEECQKMVEKFAEIAPSADKLLISFEPVDSCSGCGKLRLSPNRGKVCRTLLCPDCQRARAEKAEEKRWNEEQKRKTKAVEKRQKT